MAEIRRQSPAQIRSALGRFKFAAIAEGIALFILTGIVIMRYVVFPDGPSHATWSSISNGWSPIHGVIFLIYFVLSFDLWSRLRWKLGRFALMAFYGLVPVLSFFGERWITQRVHDEHAEVAEPQ